VRKASCVFRSTKDLRMSIQLHGGIIELCTTSESRKDWRINSKGRTLVMMSDWSESIFRKKLFLNVTSVELGLRFTITKLWQMTIVTYCLFSVSLRRNNTRMDVAPMIAKNIANLARLKRAASHGEKGN